jgi:apolipoprotein N-acyltransferase
VRYAVLLAGALPVLAFPAPNLEFLAWFGLVPGLALMRAAPTAREAAARGWWFGAGYLLAALYWLIPNLGPGLLGVAIVLGALWSGVGLATWGLLRSPVTARRALAALALVPSCWLVSEWIRSWQGIGGPWAVYGASQWQHPAILALAAVGGVWLVSFALVAANTGILIAMAAARTAVRLAGAAGAAIAIAAGPAAFALTAAPPTGRQVTIALVQLGAGLGPAARVRTSERLTAGPARNADLIVWGESSVGYDLSRDTALLGSLEHLSGSVGARLLVSQDALDAAGGKSKDAVLIGANGVDGRYVKTRLVPFGEYIPFRQQLGWLTKISKAAPQNMIPGTGARLLHATLRNGSSLRIGVLTCFESAFPDMSRADADRGAGLIIYQTSDSTFQDSWALAQHASLGALRAAETGLPVIQAALTGDSAAFDARGRLLAWDGSSYRGATVVRLVLAAAAARTPFDRLQDYVPWTATGIAAAAAALALLRLGLARRATVRPDRQAHVVWQDNAGTGRPVPVSGNSVEQARAGGSAEPAGSTAAAPPADP